MATKNKKVGKIASAKLTLTHWLLTRTNYKTIEKVTYLLCRNETFERKNYAGNTVNLYGGITAGVNLFATALLQWQSGNKQLAKSVAVSTAATTACGLIDDLDQGEHDGQTTAKGFKGHLSALSKGQVTTGIVKIGGICLSSIISATFITKRSGKSSVVYCYDLLLNAGIIASTANLHNLLDLRPGRCLKFSTMICLPLLFANRKSKAIALSNISNAVVAIRSDLAEETMLGDTGANAIGAYAGIGYASLDSRLLKTVYAVAVVGLTLLSEKVSFSKVIQSVPTLKAIDDLGRKVNDN